MSIRHERNDVVWEVEYEEPENSVPLSSIKSEHLKSSDDEDLEDNNTQDNYSPSEDKTESPYPTERQTDDIDIDLFISEMEKLPCLWNYKSKDYGDRPAKQQAWRGLCRMLYAGYEQMDSSERDVCLHKLQHKWRMLRDCFNRDIAQMARGKRKRQYIYFKQLLFLRCLNKNGAICNVNNKSRRPTVDRYKKNVPKTNTRQSMKAQTSSDNDCKTKEELPNYSNSVSFNVDKEKMVAMDGDMHFLMSLCDDLKCIDSSIKLDAKSDIIGVIRKYKKLSNSVAD